MILTPADVALNGENGVSQHTIHHFPFQSPQPQSAGNTGLLFDWNGWHRSLLKKRFIILEAAAFSSVPRGVSALPGCIPDSIAHLSRFLIAIDGGRANLIATVLDESTFIALDSKWNGNSAIKHPTHQFYLFFCFLYVLRPSQLCSLPCINVNYQWVSLKSSKFQSLCDINYLFFS